MDKNIFGKFPLSGKAKSKKEKDQIAEFLQLDADAMSSFESSYQKHVLNKPFSSMNLFDVNAKLAVTENARFKNPFFEENEDVHRFVEDIVKELLDQTAAYVYDRETDTIKVNEWEIPEKEKITPSDLEVLPKELRPQLTGNYAKLDIKESSWKMLSWMYVNYRKEKDPERKKMFYNQFRQGLDILDLDSVTYEIISRNPNSIGNWFPALVEAARKQDFFKVPSTTIINVPITLLQLTRNDYFSLNQTTLRIVDKFCQEAFQLDEMKEYFIKTGTFSSKFDFRNAHVTGAKEVRELGEYLLFIHFQALQAASPLCTPCIYGMSTTTEWCVREFIPSCNDGIPSIYKGLPLRTEYRIFVDFTPEDDSDPKIIGFAPYWEPEMMKRRFGSGNDADNPHQMHDYIIYKAHEGYLMAQYHENIETVCKQVEEMLPDVELTGQWSLDIMQNGRDFWLIDMARAQDSALNAYISPKLMREEEVEWLPDLSRYKIETEMESKSKN